MASKEDNPAKPKEMNILVLGETGVGKSTWINGLANYFTYNTLDEAIKFGPVTLIQAQYVINIEEEEEDVEKVVYVGKRPEDKDMINQTEDDYKIGESETQIPRTYSFLIGDAKIRICLIDTPGIGDTRGIEQDKINFEYIMAHISNFEELHGICILFKPNQARLTEYFIFCFQELLLHLHKDACRNVVIVFTNARGTYYKGGDTVSILRKFIRENNMQEELKLGKDTSYYLDNETVRYLAEEQSGIQHTEEELRANEANWGKSVSESKRLLLHFSCIKPHDVKNSVSLNNVSRIIAHVMKPLVQVSENIQENLDRLKEKLEELQKQENLEITLQLESAMVKKFILNVKDTDVSRLVCSSDKCRALGTAAGVPLLPYKVCRMNIDTNSLTQLKNGMQGKKKCYGFPKGLCTDCKCSWTNHDTITYELIKQEVEMEIENQIKSTKCKTSDIEQIIENIEQHVKDLKYEQGKLLTVGAKCGEFLERNSLIVKNDAIIQCLIQLIDKNEMQKNKKKSVLEKVLDLYKSIKSRNEEKTKEFTLSDIYEEIGTLFDLPINGPTLKQMYKSNENADSQIINDVVMTVKNTSFLLDFS